MLNSMNMASSQYTSYRLCCEPATTEWVIGRMKFSYYMHGWIYPYKSVYAPSSHFTWQECPFCGKDMLPFEPTRPWEPSSDDD